MKTSALIIGSGLSGLVTAYRLAEQGVECVLVSKDPEVIEESNSVYAQGGIVYRGEKDSAEMLEKDIMNAGDGISSPEAAHQLATDGIDLVKSFLMEDAEVPFDRHDGQLSLTREAAHQVNRIIHVRDHTGRAIMESLWKQVREHERITVLSGHVLVDLLTSGHSSRGYEMKYRRNWCLGAYLYDIEKSEVKKVFAPFTVLCTGGIGQIYEHHTNGEHAFGSGLAVANRARVRIINARFVQFHPTALWSDKPGRRFLISEALRGEGGRLLKQDGNFLMAEGDDLASRAVVSRAIMESLEETGDEHVWLDLASHYQGDVPISERFPTIYQHCLELGIDIAKDPIPVVPAEHFFCGGIAVDLDGQTELPGLFAAGEVACTGVHGANRLASTSLLECLTWGAKAADRIAHLQREVPPYLGRAFELVDDWESFGDEVCTEAELSPIREQIRSLMWKKVGILRSRESLFAARDELRQLWRKIDQLYTTHALSEPLIEIRHMVETAYLIAHSASSHTSLSEDSLGGHILR